VVLVSAPGHKDRREVVVLAEKQSREIVATPGASEEIPTEGAPTPAAPAPPPPVESSSSARTIGWIVAGVGAAGLGLAAVSGVVLIDYKNTINKDCTDKMCQTAAGPDAANNAKMWLPINMAAWIVGVAGVGIGAYLVIANPGGGRLPAAAGLAVVPGGLLASARASF
jgi:hypothetical protein